MLLSCSSTADPSDSVFVTLFYPAVERGSCRVHKLLRIGGVPTSLIFIVLPMADRLFGLYGSEHRGELFMCIQPSPPPHPLSPVPNKPYIWLSAYVKQNEMKKQSEFVYCVGESDMCF